MKQYLLTRLERSTKSSKPTLAAGVGYEFADWGKNQLGRAPGQTLNTGLSMSHYYINSILFNITYTL